MTTVTLLDGSVGQELVHRAGHRPTPLWSTQVMLDRPELLRDVHNAYYAAGATVATTNTYAVLRDRLARVGLEHRFTELLTMAAGEAQAARDAHGAGRIAGSIGPLIASYRPDICPPAEEAAEIYRGSVDTLVPLCDLLLIETMCSLDQAEGALRASAGVEIPVWLAVSVDDFDGTRLRSGEPLADLRIPVTNHLPDAILVNCTRPEAIPEALEIIARFNRPFGAYANGFTHIAEGFLTEAPTVDALQNRQDIDPETYTAHALCWLGQGATILGGCCEVGPAHISHLARTLRAGGHTIE